MYDEKNGKKRKNNPKDGANFLSKLFFWTETKMAFEQWKKKKEDVYAPLKKLESKRLADRLEKAWSGEETFAKKPSLARALTHVFGKEFALFGSLYFPIHLSILLLQPYFLRKLLDYYEPAHTTSLHGAYLYSAILTVLLFVETISSNTFNVGLTVLGMKIRIACTSLIYRRCLKLKKGAQLGHIINLLSNDVKRFDTAFATLHSVWMSPVKLILATCYLAMTIEYTALAGITFLVISLLIQLYISVKISNQRKQVASKSDHRICLMNHLVTNIRTVKINTLEEVLAKSVEAARDSEIQEIRKTNLLRLTNNTFKLVLVELCSYFCILAAVARGLPLTSDYVFVLRNIYDMLKAPMVTELPDALMQLSELRISITRIQDFLTLDSEEVSSGDNCVLRSVQVLGNHDIGVSLHNVSVECLKEVILRIAPGDSVALTGAGRGKSLLLKIILKEVDPKKGNVEVWGTISYASQEPWFFLSSVKQNIVFGQEMDSEKYKKIVRICALENLDDTQVEVLSVGFRARIHLARALYRDADIYLLDEPLENVESFMAQKIFEDCVQSYLKDKCVLVVTQHLHFLKNVKDIYCLKKGRLVKRKIRSVDKLEDKLLLTERRREREKTPTRTQKEQFRKNVCTGPLISYCKFGPGRATVLAILLLFILVQTLCSVTDYFVTVWVNIEEGQKNCSVKVINMVRTSTNVWIYTSLVLLLVAIAAITTDTFLKFSIKVSRKIHQTIFTSVLYATMTFYNSSPSGTILSYFSKDLGVIDEATPILVKTVIETLLTLLATGIIISIANTAMIVPTMVLFALCIFLNVVFSSNGYTKHEATNTSAIYTHLEATLRGISTIRASGLEQTMQREFEALQDAHTSSFYMMSTFAIAFNLWSELVRVLYVSLVISSFFFVQAHVGNVGLAITQSMQSSIVQESVKSWNDLSANLGSLEQVMEYTELQTEPKCEGSMQTTWSACGRVEFRNVSLKYSPGSLPALENVTFGVEAGERVGIIGRNGAGKSSLVSSLYRLFHFEGSIFIDGVDTKSVPLRILRSRILVLPYKPNFLLGNLRKNLDPFEQFTDFELWKTLHQVGLREYVSNLPLALDTEIFEDDSVFTLRQKWLLCLARGLLKEVKIIVSFSVGWRSDIFLQRVISKNFKNCTVLTLSRSLKHIAAFDRVVILYDGSAVEFDRSQLLD